LDDGEVREVFDDLFRRNISHFSTPAGLPE